MQSGIVLSCAAATAVLLAGCDPDRDMPMVADSHEVAEGHPQEGALWPVLLQHCMRTRSCDPMTRFSEGAGQASGVEAGTTWFAESAASVGADGDTFGARVILSFHGLSERGGPGGRPLTRQETPANLRAPIARQTWLSIEYRFPQGEPVPYFVTLRTAQVLLPLPKGPAAESRVALQARTAAYINAWSWPGGQTGARIEVSSLEGGALWSGHTPGFAARAQLKPDERAKLGAEPWFFDLSINLSEDRASAEPLLAAIEQGEFLRLQAASPEGTVLADLLKTDGAAQAMAAAQAALADPSIDQSLPERCLALLARPPGDWVDTVSPALRTCDPRTPQQRRLVPGYAPK